MLYLLHTESRSSHTDSKASSAGFTLTELIIVVAILVTLGTIAFASYSEYTISSRDAKRSSDLVTIRGNLSTYSAKNGGYPKPANFVEIRATAATGSTILLRQGIIDSTLATSLDIAGGGRDPSTNQGYTLSVDAQGKRAQVLAYFEKTGAEVQLSSNFPSITQSVYAEDTPLADKFPISAGEKLGTFVQSGSLIPLEQIQTGSIALPTLSGSGFMVVGGCLTNERMTSVATGYPEGLYEEACKYIPYVSSVLNSMGQNGDEMIAYDNRVYTHPAAVIAANGGNPDFFDKKYRLFKFMGRWWFKDNMRYPTYGNSALGTIGPNTYNDIYCPPDATNTSLDCARVGSSGYMYDFNPAAGACPPGWSLISRNDLVLLNSGSNGNSSVLTKGIWGSSLVGSLSYQGVPNGFGTYEGYHLSGADGVISISAGSSIFSIYPNVSSPGNATNFGFSARCTLP